VYFFTEANLPNTLFAEFFWAVKFANFDKDKDLIVWLDGARPANTYIPPSFLGTHLHSRALYPPPKNTFASIGKLANF
jgi:hypothetical protein